MMTLKQVSFTLENCEHISIPGYYIGDICVEGITTSISRVAANAVMKMETCHEFAVEIHCDANRAPYTVFGYQPEEKSPIQTIFDRLTYFRDITQISIVLTDNEYYEENFDEHTETYEYFLNWKGSSEYENSAQSAKVSNRGDLYIVVSSKGDTVEQYFSTELEPDSAEDVDFKFKMYEVGDDNHKDYVELMRSCRNELEEAKAVDKSVM